MSALSLEGYVASRLAQVWADLDYAKLDQNMAQLLAASMDTMLRLLRAEGVLESPVTPPVLAAARVGDMVEIAVGVDNVVRLQDELMRYPERFIQPRAPEP
jgi:hypothetical protein